MKAIVGRYTIDQSGHIEYTSHNTVIAYTNECQKAILIKAKDKRNLQEIFRKMGKRSVFVIRIFSLLIFLLLKDEKSLKKIIIDKEYPGWDAQIKNYILSDFNRIGIKLDPSIIEFKEIGKTSEAHWQAYYVFKKKRKAEIIVTEKEILNELFH